MLLMLDNCDSFTFNLVQYFRVLGIQVEVRRSDEVDVEGIRRLAPRWLVVSPGPGRPEDAGISLQAVRALAGQVPILGVCLGHQCIAQAFGGTVVRAQRPMHGKVSPVHHDGAGVFRGLPSPYAATRYHSLVVDPASVPDCLEVTAWTQTPEGRHDEIMGVRHRTLPLEGIQVHPEAILTEHGYELLRNFLEA